MKQYIILVEIIENTTYNTNTTTTSITSNVQMPYRHDFMQTSKQSYEIEIIPSL